MQILAHEGAMFLTGIKKFEKKPKHDFWTYWSVLGAFVEKTHFVIRAANFCQLMPILAHEVAMFLSGIKKFVKKETLFFDILECIGCVRGKNSLRDSRGELLSIKANIGTRGCVVFDRNEKVQKTPKHDFCTYSSVLAPFVEKTHFMIRAANFCQLMPILAYIEPPRVRCFMTGMEKFKKHEDKIFGHIGVRWVRSWQKLTS